MGESGQLETAVTAVTVYPDRARVTVSGSIALAAGVQRVVVDELPLSLERDSVRVTGKGEQSVRILGVDVVQRHYTETPAVSVQALEQQIEQLQDQLRVVVDERAGWQAHETYLMGLRQATEAYAKGLAKGQSTVADQSDLIVFIQDQDRALRAAVRELDKRERDLQRELSKLQQELKQVGAARPRQRFAAEIELDAAAAGEVVLSLTYVVGRAGWRPLYDVRLVQTENGRMLTVSLLAEIQQDTGQPWPQVALHVSTARPALNQRLPELKPWFVDVVPSPPLPSPRTMAVRAEMVTAAVVPERAAKMQSAEMAVADLTTMDDGGTAVAFRVTHPADIPSDGAPHKTLLAQFSLDPKLDFLTAPRHTDAVFRRVTVTNTSGGPLLAGGVSLFAGDEFIGKTRLDYTPAGGEIELLLGAEERITVERELVRRDVDKKLLRDNRQLRYGYEIRLQNLLPDVADIVVQDQIPVSRHEQIKVKLDQVQPDPAEKSDLNMLEWRLSVASQAEQTVRYQFVIEHPRDLRVMGLPD